MSKNKHTRKFYAQKPRVLAPTPDELLRAVKRAEKIVIAMIQEKGVPLPPIGASTLLALCTKAVLVGKDTFEASDEELLDIVKSIFSLSSYQAGPDFPYTKEQMLEAWLQDAQRGGSEP